jgi:ATP diphosphatase
MDDLRYSLSDLLRVMQRLRDPETGCPWDVRQDFYSIIPSTLEECYELAQAIEDQDFDHIAEELGDVLFQVVFYTQLGSEKNLFSFDDVVQALVKKLIRRHPHVFARGEIEGVVFSRSSVEEIKRNWEDIKQLERDQKNQTGSLADVPLALPALPRAQKVQKRAAQVNFDWVNTQSVLDKVQEELDELREAMESGRAKDIKDEMGDIFFSFVNLARHLGLDAEETLRHSTSKFEQRFEKMEALVADDGGALAALSEKQLDQLWRQAKDELCNSR